MAPAKKISITIDAELLDEVRERADGNVSAWLGEAAEHQLKLQRGREFLRELEAINGPITDAVREEIRRQWPESPSTAAS